jgi:hypothetical protein
MTKENRQPLHMVGKEFKYQVRVKRVVGGQAANDRRITPGMVLLAINGTRIDRKLLRVQDKRGLGIASLKRVTTKLALKPVALVFMDCVLLREKYLSSSGSGLRHDRDESWMRQSVYSFCASEKCSFWEYDELLKMVQIDVTKMRLEHQLAELDSKFSREAKSSSSEGASITGKSHDFFGNKQQLRRYPQPDVFNFFSTGFYHLSTNSPVWQAVASQQLGTLRASPM